MLARKIRKPWKLSYLLQIDVGKDLTAYYDTEVEKFLTTTSVKHKDEEKKLAVYVICDIIDHLKERFGSLQCKFTCRLQAEYKDSSVLDPFCSLPVHSLGLLERYARKPSISYVLRRVRRTKNNVQKIMPNRRRLNNSTSTRSQREV